MYKTTVGLAYSSIDNALEIMDKYGDDQSVIEIFQDRDLDMDETVYLDLESAKKVIEDLGNVVFEIESAKFLRDEEKRLKKEEEARNEQQRKGLEDVEARVDAIKATGYFVTANEATLYLTEAEQAVLKMIVEKATRLSR